MSHERDLDGVDALWDLQWHDFDFEWSGESTNVLTADLVLCKYCRCLVEPDEPHYCTLEDANG
jgi:hypothetical protein